MRSHRSHALVLAGLLATMPLSAAGEPDLTQRLAENQAETVALTQRLDKLEAQLQNQGLIGMLNQISGIKADLSRLRGAQEEQAHQLAQVEKRQKTLYGDLDERLKELAAQLADLHARQALTVAPVAEAVRLQPAQSLTAPAAAVADVGPEDGSKAYEAALGHFKAGDYKAAVAAFQSFHAAHARSPLAPNALYWMGLSYGTLGDSAKAAAAYEKLISDHPGSAKAPDAMVSLARAHLQLGNPTAARAQLDAVVAKYPASKSAESARKLLATLN